MIDLTCVNFNMMVRRLSYYPPKVGQPDQTPTALKKTNGINIINVKAFDQELKKVFHLRYHIYRSCGKESNSIISPLMIKEFIGVFPKHLLDKFPLVHDI